MHQIAPILSKNFVGGGGVAPGPPPPPPSTSGDQQSRQGYLLIWYVINYMLFFINFLLNVDQIYSFLLKLKLNFCIGPSSNYKQNTFYGYKNKCFDFI